MTDKVRVLEMSDEERIKRCRQIYVDYGIDATLLCGLLTDIGFQKEIGLNLQLSKHQIRKLRRRLQGSYETFERIAEIISIHKQVLDEKTDGGYCAFIRSNMNSARYQMYLDGDWTSEILRIVCLAQKKFGYGARPKSRTEVKNSTVRFVPRSEFSSYTNR